jgi:bacterioferritin-associated ferredoxin
MIVCLCYGISEEDIRKSIRAGNWTCKDVGMNCGAGMGCGSCCKEICKMVNEEKRKRLLDAVDRLNSGVSDSIDEIVSVVGDLTINEILDMAAEAFGEKPATETKPTDDEGEGELQ